MMKQLRCCEKNPAYEITYRVGDVQRKYLVCSDCSAKPEFQKFVIERKVMSH